MLLLAPMEGLLDATLAPDATLLLELTAPAALAFGYGEDGTSVAIANANDGGGAALRVFGCSGAAGQRAPALAEARP